MSTSTGRKQRSLEVDTDSALSPKTFRWLALGGVLALTASYVYILQEEVTSVVGGTQELLALVIVMLAVATLLERTISPRLATILSIIVGSLGFAYYLTVAGVGVGILFSATDRIVSDTVALATGMRLLRMMEAGTWTLGFVPGPVFLSWYFALRRRYALAVVPGGIALLFLVLTGVDAVGATVLGTIGAIATIGFGELERYRGTIAQADVLAVLFALTIALSLSVSMVPGGTSGPTVLVGGSGDNTLEGSITDAPDETTIAGSVDLSPEVRFTVRSEQESYWRTGVYDRFTGDGWVRTGQQEDYHGPISGPPGETNTVRQTVFVEDDTQVMPTAPHPVDIQGDVTENTEYTSHGQFRPIDPLIEGDTYNVESAVIDATPAELRRAGTVYPEEITDGSDYFQRVEDTSSAFEDRTAEIIDDADADNPYDTAKAIEDHLRTSKDYSLNVSRPDGNVAEDFLLEMDEGYCVYFATTMTQMLRAEEIPARYVTGYTSGQQVDDNEWTVRGLNAHAWVEVYFPGHGWVEFEPTPSSDRDEVHDGALEDAREDGESNVDTDESADVPVTEDDSDTDLEIDPGDVNDSDESDDPEFDGNDSDSTPSGDDNVTESDDPTETPPDGDPDHPDRLDRPPESGTDADWDGEFPSPADEPDDGDESAGDGTDGPSPTAENAILGLAILLGLAAGAHRTGITAHASREARLHWQGFQNTPEADVDRAYHRLEEVLETRYRPREAGETMRQYLSSGSESGSVGSRAVRVGELYERATYGDGVDQADADEAVALVDAMARERLPVIGRFWR